MARRHSIFLATLLASGCAPGVAAQMPASAQGSSPTQVTGFVRELTWLEVTLADGSKARLEALVTRPDQPGRAPLVLMNHGSPRDASAREKMRPTGYASQAMAFARRGYAVVVVMRRGYGRTDGPYAESSGSCSDKDYVVSARVSADDVLGALHRLQEESWVDPDRVVLLGHSAGGFAVTAAAATNPRGVVAVISFAGGRGSDAPDHICRPDRLIAAERELGTTGRVPSLWIYAQNDHFFEPVVADQMADAYASAGGVVRFVKAPAFGADGHMLFSQGPIDLWWPDIAPFLAKLGLPVEVVRARVSPKLEPPSTLSPAGRVGFEAYVASEGYEKAFAAGKAAWASATGERTRLDAAETALRRCSEHGNDCVVYAVGDEYAR